MPVGSVDSAALLTSLTEQIGPRRATSSAEAVVAAQLNARLRQAGFSVDTRPVPALDRPGARLLPVALALLALTALSVWYPLSGIVLGPWLMTLVIVDALLAPLPVLRRRSFSQNIIAARPIEPLSARAPAQPRWRLLILAPLDTPPAWSGLDSLQAPTYNGLLARLLVSSAPLITVITALSFPGLRWPVALAGLIAVTALAWSAQRQPALQQPDGGLAALAAMIMAAQQLPSLCQVEVWMIAVGASYCDQNGVKTVLARYPFDPSQTLVISLHALARGQLAIISRDGVFRHERADPFLCRLATAADRADPTIDLEPHTLAARDELLSPMRRRRFRAISIQAVPNGDAHLNPHLAERAARLLAAIAQMLDNEADHDLSVARS